MELFYFTAAGQLDSWVQTAAQRAGGESGTEFLQSWAWGEILRNEGEEILRVGVKDRGQIVAAVTLYKQSLAAAYFYWFSPRGPLYSPGTLTEVTAVANFLSAAIKQLDRRALFWRIEPANPEVIAALGEAGQPALKKTVNLEPAQTLVLDLTAGSGKLLADLQQKTRYNLKLAMKKGVKIRVGTPADWSEFWRLMTQTGARDGFRLHATSHYQALLNFDPNFIKLYLAEYQGQIIATGLFCFWGDQATYLHGASDHDGRSVMAPYLLQWSVIQDALAAGYKYYDFYGIDEQKWPGVTRFKCGFGGRRLSYPGTYDVIFQPGLYRLYGWVRRLRRLTK